MRKPLHFITPKDEKDWLNNAPLMTTDEDKADALVESETERTGVQHHKVTTC